MAGDVNQAKVAQDLVAALRDAIKKDRQGKFRTGVVRISDFKRSNLESWVAKEFLPDRMTLVNAHMWDHLRGHVPDALLSEIDDVVAAAIEDLEHRGFVKRGGEVDSTRYPEDDWLTLSMSGVKKFTSGEPLFPAATDDGIHFDQRQFHPELVTACRKLFADGHYAQAVFEACKLINSNVKAKSGSPGDGSSLMTQVFSPGNPVLRFNDLKNQSDKDEQQGFMHLFQGAMLGIRNPGAHDMVALNDQTRTLEYLSFLSLLLRRLDEAKK